MNTHYKQFLMAGMLLAIAFGGCKFNDQPDRRSREGLTEVMISPEFCEVQAEKLPTTCKFKFENIGGDSLRFSQPSCSFDLVQVVYPKQPTPPNGVATVEMRIPKAIPKELAQVTGMVHANTPKAQHAMRVIVVREKQ